MQNWRAEYLDIAMKLNKIIIAMAKPKISKLKKKKDVKIQLKKKKKL